MAALELNFAIKIKASPKDVFDLLADIKRHPELFKGFLAIRNFHGGVPKVGDKWIVVTEFMGSEISNEYTIMQLVPEKTIAFDAISSQAKTSNIFQLEEIEEGTKLRLSVEGNPRNLFASVGMSLVEENLKNGVIEDLKNIRSILES